MPSSWRLDIDLPRSGSAQFTVLANDVTGQPVDLQGVDVNIEALLQSGDDTPFLTKGVGLDDSTTGIVLTDAAHGQFLCTYYGSDFDALDGKYEVVRLSHKIRMTKDGDAPLLIFGQINLLPE